MRAAAVVVALAAAALPGRARAERTYTEKSATHDCAKDPNVAINASDGTFTLTGTCDKVAVNGGKNRVTAASAAKVVITGSRNTIDVEAADRITVTGTDNTINYKRGATVRSPKVTAIGANNKLNLIK